MRIVIVFFLVMAFFNMDAQNGTPPAGGAKGIAMGNLGVSFNDINAAFANQAGLAFLPKTAFTLFGESRFALSEIKTVSAAAALPTKSGTFGLTVSYFGYESYNEQRLGIAYARKLMDKLAIGIQFDVLNTTIPNYGRRTLFSFEAGLQYEVLDNLTVGVHAFSPVRVEIVEDEDLPTVFELGFAYKASDKVTFYGEVEKDIEYPLVVKIGLEYSIVTSFYLRGGINLNPTQLSFGLGYEANDNLSIDVGASFHQTLGVSPALSVNYNLQ